MESLMIKNNSGRDFRWPELTILAGDTVEVHQDKLKEIPVLNKLLKARELEIVGAKGCGEDEKEEAKENAVEKNSTKDSKKDKKGKEKAKEEDEDVSSVLKSLK